MHQDVYCLYCNKKTEAVEQKDKIIYTCLNCGLYKLIQYKEKVDLEQEKH